MKRLADGGPELGAIRVVYADLDGTLLGPGGSLFAGPRGGVTGRAAAAVEAVHRRGIHIVVMSGRSRRSAEVARALGASAFIAELGAILVEGPGPQEVVIRNHGEHAGEDSAEAIARSGAGALLLERFPGRLLPTGAWTEASMVFHGLVDPAEANAALAEAGQGWLELQDNGRLRRTYRELYMPEVHAYHLLPRGVNKASAVRLHRERTGIAPSEAVAVGDSPSDLQAASQVAAFFLVANGLAGIGDEVALPGNAYVTASERGEGFAEAVEAMLRAPKAGK